MQNGNTTLAKKAQRVTVRRRLFADEKERPRFVDYHANARDLLCVMLASIGWSTAAIAEHTELSEGQVQYRITKAEHGRRKGELTQRMAYRHGKGDVATAIVTNITGRGSVVKRQVEITLGKRGLFDPRPTGVLRHNGK